jgi:hypothetical protein
VGKKGPSLTLEIPKRYSGESDVKFIKLMISLKKRIGVERDRARGKLEAALFELEKETGYSRSFLMKAWTWTLKDTILRSSKHNPQPVLSPREPGES